MNKSIISAVVISLTLVFVYIGARSIPSAKCGFLHYEEVVLEDGTIELCAVSESGFVDLSLATPPVRVVLDSPADWQKGEPYSGLLHLETLTNKILYPQDLAVTHTKKLHIMLINKSLSDYHHIHPVPLDGSEYWEFSFTPNANDEYVLFADFVPTQTRRQVIGREYILPSDHNFATDWNFSQSKEQGDFIITLHMPEKVSPNQAADLTLTIARRDGTPAKLEKVMDAYGHLVAFQAGLQGMGHIHPTPTGSEYEDVPELAFTFNTPISGKYRIWAQFKVDGVEKFVPFDLQVEPS